MPSDLESAIEQGHVASAEIIKGDAKPFEDVFSQRDDVTLGNPFGPFARGRQAVLKRLAVAAANYREGEIVGFEPIARYVTEDLACIVEVESLRAKVGGGDELVPVSVRCTSVYRPEDGTWKLVHRHADPITSERPAESVIQK